MTTLLILSASLLLVTTGIAVAILQYRGTGSSMKMMEFFRRFVRGKGVRGMSAAALDERLSPSSEAPLIVDLSQQRATRAERIPGALQLDFDDFLREVLVEQKYDVVRHRDLVIVCDHGNLSRIAGDVLVEDAGFTRVHSLRGGMRSWRKHRRSVAAGYCCPLSASLATCCR